jgi:hypothetical protein
LECHKDSMGIIRAWLEGYYQDEDDPPVCDTDKFEADAKSSAFFVPPTPSSG